MSRALSATLLCLFAGSALSAQQTPMPTAGRRVADLPAPPTAGDSLRGTYGPYRANNDLSYYHLDVRVDPARKYLSGKNTIRFKMLQDGTRIQVDLVRAFNIDKILLAGVNGQTTPLKWERAADRTVYVNFPRTLRKGSTYSIDFYYSGTPVEMGRFGGIVFRKDPMGRPLVNTACEEEGASVWWPNKDQWRDEPDEGMDISVEAPSDLVEVSGGRFQGKKVLGDGYTRWNWTVHYPINNYDVSLNVGTYVHLADSYEGLTLDYFVFPEDLAKAKAQFVQVKDMLEAYGHFFGSYPFPKDGYKLVEALYSGVENQTAITYGNGFANGFLGRPKTGIGAQFDFIIVHESAHEWFGNSITARDRSDMWIHEGWANYAETLFVEYMWGKDSAIKYVNTGKAGVKNTRPVISEMNVFSTPPGDQYKKGTLILNTVRSVVHDDAKWFRVLHDYYQHFKYQTIMTTDLTAFFSKETGLKLTPIFDEYLRHAAIPVLELRFDQPGRVQYRWKAEEKGFAMPVEVGKAGAWKRITPTAEWQTMPTALGKDDFGVATDYFYVDVSKS